MLLTVFMQLTCLLSAIQRYNNRILILYDIFFLLTIRNFTPLWTVVYINMRATSFRCYYTSSFNKCFEDTLWNIKTKILVKPNWHLLVFIMFQLLVVLFIIRSFIKRQTSGTLSDNEWQRMTTSGTTSDNEWQLVVQRVTTNDCEWQRQVQ